MRAASARVEDQHALNLGETAFSKTRVVSRASASSSAVRATIENGSYIAPACLLHDAPPEIVDAVAAVLMDEMNAHLDGTGVALGAAFATVTARPA